MNKFENGDLENAKLREFTQEQRKTQNWKKVLFDQQLDIEMRCDFIAKRSQSRGSNSSIDHNKEEEHPMSKYR